MAPGFLSLATIATLLGAASASGPVAATSPARDPIELPSLQPDLRLVLTRTYSEPVAILQPQDKADAGAPALISTGRRLEAWEPATGKARWSIDFKTETQPELLAALRDRLIISTSFTIVSLDPGTGQKQWRIGQEPDPAVTARRDPEFLPRVTLHALTPTCLLAISSENQGFLLRLTDGTQIWQQKLEHRPAGPLALNERFVAYAAAIEGRSGIVVLDAADGRELHVIKRSDARQISFLQFAAEGSLIAAGADWLRSYDPGTGDAHWNLQVPAGLRTSELRLRADKLFAVLADGRIAAYDVSNGHRLWRRSFRQGDTAHFVGRPQSAGDRTIRPPGLIAATDRSLAELDISTGQPRWRYEAPAGTTLGPACLTRDYILVHTHPEPSAASIPVPTAPAAGTAERLSFISRATGQLAGEPLDLSAPESRPTYESADWSIYDRAILIRRGQSIACWTNLPASQPATH